MVNVRPPPRYSPLPHGVALCRQLKPKQSGEAPNAHSRPHPNRSRAHLDQYIANLIPKHAQDKVRIGYIPGEWPSPSSSNGQVGRTRLPRPSPTSPGLGTASQTAPRRCTAGTGTTNGTSTTPAPNAGLRGGAAGDQGRPDGDLLGLKGTEGMAGLLQQARKLSRSSRDRTWSNSRADSMSRWRLAIMGADLSLQSEIVKVRKDL